MYNYKIKKQIHKKETMSKEMLAIIDCYSSDCVTLNTNILDNYETNSECKMYHPSHLKDSITLSLKNESKSNQETKDYSTLNFIGNKNKEDTVLNFDLIEENNSLNDLTTLKFEPEELNSFKIADTINQSDILNDTTLSMENLNTSKQSDILNDTTLSMELNTIKQSDVLNDTTLSMENLNTIKQSDILKDTTLSMELNTIKQSDILKDTTLSMENLNTIKQSDVLKDTTLSMENLDTIKQSDVLNDTTLSMENQNIRKQPDVLNENNTTFSVEAEESLDFSIKLENHTEKSGDFKETDSSKIFLKTDLAILCGIEKEKAREIDLSEICSMISELNSIEEDTISVNNCKKQKCEHLSLEEITPVITTKIIERDVINFKKKNDKENQLVLKPKNALLPPKSDRVRKFDITEGIRPSKVRRINKRVKKEEDKIKVNKIYIESQIKVDKILGSQKKMNIMVSDSETSNISETMPLCEDTINLKSIKKHSQDLSTSSTIDSNINQEVVQVLKRAEKTALDNHLTSDLETRRFVIDKDDIYANIKEVIKLNELKSRNLVGKISKKGGNGRYQCNWFSLRENFFTCYNGKLFRISPTNIVNEKEGDFRLPDNPSVYLKKKYTLDLLNTRVYLIKPKVSKFFIDCWSSFDNEDEFLDITDEVKILKVKKEGKEYVISLKKNLLKTEIRVKTLDFALKSQDATYYYRAEDLDSFLNWMVAFAFRQGKITCNIG